MLLKPVEWGFPINISRNTDVPAFWMHKFWGWVDSGFLEAPHPNTAMPAFWSMAPKDVHSLVWWSKDFRKFLKHPRRTELDSKYRQIFKFTITGDSKTELRVPELEIQLENFAEMVSVYGVEKVSWRFSPIPIKWENFEKIADFMFAIGIKECYYSFLHSDTKTPDLRSLEVKKEILIQMAKYLDERGMSLFGCWDDKDFSGLQHNIHQATCVDAYKINEIYKIDGYGLKHLKDDFCNCSKAIESSNQHLMPCPHGCTYCYAAVDKTFDV